jgi:sporulation protein YlmC with PRC-barrel domain
MTTASGHTSAIGAKHVIGTAVFNTKGDKIGQVEDIMLDKKSNNIMYGVVGFGGFLGIGEKYHPIPWTSLDFSEDKDGYIVPFTKEQLTQGPAHSLKELTEQDGYGPRNAAYDYYKVDRYWAS